MPTTSITDLPPLPNVGTFVIHIVIHIVLMLRSYGHILFSFQMHLCNQTFTSLNHSLINFFSRHGLHLNLSNCLENRGRLGRHQAEGPGPPQAAPGDQGCLGRLRREQRDHCRGL